jgi:hypothetical protein
VFLSSGRLGHYAAGARLALDGLSDQRPDLADVFARTTARDIVVVEGTMDRVEQILDLLAVPYTRVAPGELARRRLDPSQILIVNCPGEVGTRAVFKVRQFVRAGGTLLSTDWALRNLVQLAFPGMIVHNGVKTADAVVGIKPADPPHPLLEGAFDAGDDAQWWLEHDSHPILVLARGTRPGAAAQHQVAAAMGGGAGCGAVPTRRRGGLPHGQPLLPAAHGGAHRPARGSRSRLRGGQGRPVRPRRARRHGAGRTGVRHDQRPAAGQPHRGEAATRRGIGMSATRPWTRRGVTGR